MIVDTARSHDMVPIIQQMRMEHEHGRVLKQKKVKRWPVTDRFYMYYKVMTECKHDPDDAQLGEINSASLLMAHYEVTDMNAFEVSLQVLSEDVKTFLKEYKVHPERFDLHLNDSEIKLMRSYELGETVVKTKCTVPVDEWVLFVSRMAVDLKTVTHALDIASVV